MDTDAVRWFQQVADGVTVTEVSQVERVTQSGVSRALARLESEVGTPLFRRAGRTLRMTHAGAAFKQHIDAMMYALDDALAAVDQVVDPETGTVALAFQASLGAWLVPDLIGSFRREHPDVQFELLQVRDELVTSGSLRGHSDLEISTWRPRTPGVAWRSLLVEPLRLVVPDGHSLASRARIRLADAADEPFVMLRPPSLLTQQSEELCIEAGFEALVAFEGDDLPTVRGFVAAGLGVAIVPAPRAGTPVGAGPLHYLEISEPRAVREIGLAWSAERRLLPAADMFRDHVIARVSAREIPAVIPRR